MGFSLAKLGVNYGQDCRITGFTGWGFLWLSWWLTMDRITGLQDLQDKGVGLSWGLTMDRITGLRDLQGCYKSNPVHPV